MKNKEYKDKFIKNILQKLFKISDVISVTITGSISKNINFNKISDIDTIVVVKNLNKKIFNKCIQSINNISIKISEEEKFQIIINSSFGPLKLKKNDKQIVIHLMIYDVKGHIDHCINSPFTCYDWERSKTYLGKPLKKIYSPMKLQIGDFINSRRSISSYINDINSNRLSYRIYVFREKRYIQQRLFIKLKDNQKFEYYFHIINFLVLNYIKFQNSKNFSPNNNLFKKKFI